MEKNMDTIVRISFYLVLLVITDQAFSAKTLIDPFPLGTIGCLVSDVCDEEERCKNDLLFGRCEPRGRGAGRGAAPYELRPGQVSHLDHEIRRLIRAGFTWRDAYTQCVLQNTLVEFAFSRTFESQLCEATLRVSQWADLLADEVADVLQTIIEREDAEAVRAALRNVATDTDSWTPDAARDYAWAPDNADANALVDKRSQASRDALPWTPLYGGNAEAYTNDAPRGETLAQLARDAYLRDQERDAYLELQGDQGYGYPSLDDIEKMNSNKRDEIVQIHKYFDKSNSGQLKRKSYNDNIADYLNIYNELTYPTREPSLSSLSSLYYQNSNQEINDPRILNYLSMGKDEPTQFRYPSASSKSMETSLSNILGRRYPYDRNQKLKTFSMNEYQPKEPADDPIISPRDESMLLRLIDGDLEPRDLSAGDQGRLAAIVKWLIEYLQTTGGLDATPTTFGDALVESQTSDLPSVVATPTDDYLLGDLEDAAARVDGAGDQEKVESEIPIPIPQMLEQEIIKKEMEDELLNPDNRASTPRPPPAATSAQENIVKDDVFYVEVEQEVNLTEARDFVKNLTRALNISDTELKVDHVSNNNKIAVNVHSSLSSMSAPEIAEYADADDGKMMKEWEAKNKPRVKFEQAYAETYDGTAVGARPPHSHVALTLSLVAAIAGGLLAVVVIYLVKRRYRSRKKLQNITTGADFGEATSDYQDLCRQRMQGKTSEKPEPLHAAQRIGSASEAQRSPSSRSSTSSWSEEPAATNMDISTGHIVLAYMEDHLKNQDRLDKEWEAVSGYVADPALTAAALEAANSRKSRYPDVLPYDHSRVILASSANVANSDFINASFITDHDPRNPAYICTQGPLPHTVADFWQMVWEQGSVVIVMLTRLMEGGASLCHRYWPEEGSDLYHIYEVHLVSEHIWCDDYLVRSFYLKNLQTNETRTVTQFHFLTWPQLSVPASIKALLDFRRKVNKSFRGRSCPIVVHCNDGCGRAGTYCLIDMVLNKMAKGAKEIDMAATLEHIRDQRMSVVETKEQFQFSLAAVAEEVHAILKALPQ